MKKKLTSMALCLSMVLALLPTAALATGGTVQVLNASALSTGELSTDTTVGGFTIKATADKRVTVDSNEQTSDQYHSFTKRLKMGGAGAADYRSISFTTTEANAQLTIYALSANNTVDRSLSIYDSNGNAVAPDLTVSGANNLLDADKMLPAITETLQSAGTYSIRSNGDIYIYYVSVTEGTPAEVSFTDGDKPEVVSVTLTPNGRGTYTFVCQAIRAGAERTYITSMTCAAFWERGFVGLADSAGTIEIDSTAEKITMTAGNISGSSGGKLADSEDSFLYYYTEIDPETENFTLTGTFTVIDADENINQSGFGVMAVDMFVNKSSEDRYFNSAGCMVRKYIQTVNGNAVPKYGIPGGYFITGYRNASNMSSGSRKTIDTAAFDWNAESFNTNDVYTLTLKKDNTGFHAIMSGYDEVICYEPELLLQQDVDRYYVGFAVARKITVEISNIQFSTSNPATDSPRTSRPATPVTPTCDFTTASTSPSADYKAGFIADYKGTLAVYDSSNNLVENNIAVDPTSGSFIATADLTLVKGVNEFHAVFTPSSDSEQGDLLGENETIDPEQTITVPFTVSYQQYGTSDNCIYVSNSGSPTGTGNKNSPLDIYTAVAYAQPGQEIVLASGTYNLAKPLDIERGHSGTAASPITLMSDPDSGEKVILDGTNCAGDMIKLSGDYWHLYNLEVKNAKNNCKGVLISGNHNTVEKLTVSGCGSTGIQISGKATKPKSLWPSYNLVLSCESYNNCDPQQIDADGFAAKLTVGDGNVFRYCIAHHNINDGWDLYTKADTGAIGVVTIDQCVAYANGTLSDDLTAVGEGNGFKLGGDGVSVAHQLTNSIAYNNRNNGVFSNTNPGCQITNVTSYANVNGCNLKLNTKVGTDTTTWLLDGFISHGVAGTADSISVKNQATLLSETNFIDGSNLSSISVESKWFESLDTSIVPTIAQDGSIDMHGLLTLTGSAPAGVGAVISVNDNPTALVPGSEIKDQKSVTDTAETNMPSTSTNTTTNPDGSVTTTETVRKPDGSTQITKTTQKLDGSREQSVVTEGKQSDGSTVKSETSVKTDSEGKTTASAAVTSDSENGYATIPAAVLESLSESDEAELTIETPNGCITLSGDAIRALADKGSTAPTLQIVPVDSDKLPPNVRQAAEGMQVFSLTVDGAGIDFGGEAEIGLPYTRKAPHTVLNIYYVASNGERTLMTGSGMKNGMARFRTDHLSYYAIEEAVMPFADVNVDGYYAQSVLWAVNNSITTGNTATAFSPDEACTRAQAVTFLWRADGSPEPSITENPFTDVAADAYYYKAVLWAAEKGITNGDTATTFAPDKTCTRAQIVTFQWRAAGKPVTDYAMSMSDVGEGAYYIEAVRWALSEQITNGETETTFAPDADCTRAQIVTFLYRRLG